MNNNFSSQKKSNTNYLIVGSGKVARHFEHYFNLLNVSTIKWSRKGEREEKISLFEKSKDVSKILLLIKDDEIEIFIKQNPFLETKILIHFSGALNNKNCFGSHPLMTFGNELYTLDIYKNIPFIVDFNNDLFKELFPELPNKSYFLHPSKKPYYHALCAMAGNFTSILWEKCFIEFEKNFSLPSHLLFPFIERVFLNLESNPYRSLTGPFERKDLSTISKNLNALKDDPFLEVYKAFFNIYFDKRGEENKVPLNNTLFSEKESYEN